VAMIQEEETTEVEQVSGAKKNKSHIAKLCEALQNLTTHVASLSQARTNKEDDKPPKTKQNDSGSAKQNSGKCCECERSNPEGRCTHCYKCGSSEHWAIVCRKRKDTL